MTIEVVTVPYRYDQRRDGSGRGPDALLEAGLIDRLQRAGLPSVTVSEAELPDEDRSAGAIAVNVGRLGAHTAELVAAARGREAGVLVLAGDDTAMVGVISGLQRQHGADARIGLIWMDAHGDFNTPETSYSGILAGMPVAILAGLAGPLWRGAAGLAAPISTDRIVISGVRDLDEREETLLQSTDVQVVRGKDVAGHERAVHRLLATCDLICLHIDLDVLDPTLVPSSVTPEPGGFSLKEARAAIAVATASGKVGVISVAGLNPGGGLLGRRSVASTLELLEATIPVWALDNTEKDDARADA